MQVRRGGRSGPPKTLTYAFSDYVCGMLGAFAAMLGLYERTRSGRGQHLRSSLAQASSLLASRYLLSYAGHVRADIEGIDARGESALERLYEAGDGWLYLHASGDAGWRRLCAVEGLTDLAADERLGTDDDRRAHDAALAAALTTAFAGAPRVTWMERLRAAGVDAAERLRVPEFEGDPFLERSGILARRESPELGRVQHVGADTVTMSRSPRVNGRVIPRLGGDLEEILDELGYPEAEREQLRASSRAASAAESVA
jgi:crotonobetainyl-CoA:carnitine CoA-transferase CaiB-like acyl-CoA transferase